jgi:hypothetical protein
LPFEYCTDYFLKPFIQKIPPSRFPHEFFCLRSFISEP